MRTPRSCWPFLVDKAHKAVSAVQTEIAASRQRLEQLQANRERLVQLYAEYHQRETSLQAGSLGMQAHMNQRQFMAQLLGLQQRVDVDIAQARASLAQQQARLVQAELEHQKMRALQAQDQAAVHKEQQQREQRQMDELGVMQFNLRRLQG